MAVSSLGDRHPPRIGSTAPRMDGNAIPGVVTETSLGLLFESEVVLGMIHPRGSWFIQL